jgi:hypothetical protein
VAVIQCQQNVTLESCCDPVQCPKAATMHRPESGDALCQEHYNNGVTYGISGQWYVATRAVPLPEGWEPVPPEEQTEADAAAPTLEAVEAGSGTLVVEHASLGSSGLVLG